MLNGSYRPVERSFGVGTILKANIYLVDVAFQILIEL